MGNCKLQFGVTGLQFHVARISLARRVSVKKTCHYLPLEAHPAV